MSTTVRLALTPADREATTAVLGAIESLNFDALSPCIARMWKNLAADLRDVLDE